MTEDSKTVLNANIAEIEKLLFQMNKVNEKEVLGRIYFCLVAIRNIIE